MVVPSTREEWLDELDGRIYERATTDSKKLTFLLFEIFQNMPSEDAEILLEERDVNFVLPIANSVIELHHTFHESALEDDGFGSKIEWLVMLRSDLIDGSKDNFTYTVAHELSHVLLGHSSGEDSGGPERELDADRLVIKWGFEKELRASPDNYLYGNGEYQKEIRESARKKGHQ